MDDPRVQEQVKHLLQTTPPTPWRRIRALTGANNHLISRVRNDLHAPAPLGALPERSMTAAAEPAPVPLERSLVPIAPASLLPVEQPEATTDRRQALPSLAWLGLGALAVGILAWRKRQKNPLLFTDDLGTRFLVPRA